nr:MAG TPA: Phosphopantetheine adenylyltransferase [Bacteriophage sp.]
MLFFNYNYLIMKIFLYPGAFKPFHDGHYMLLKRFVEVYKDNSDVFFIIIVSSTNRDFIDIDKGRYFISTVIEDRLCKNNGMVYIDKNPMHACYSLVGKSFDNQHTINDLYSIICSSKGNDNNRFDDFYSAFNKGGKYYKGINKIFKTNITTEPLIFEDIEPVNATILRKYIKDNDYNKFSTGYKHMLSDGIISENELKTYFNTLRK